MFFSHKFLHINTKKIKNLWLKTIYPPLRAYNLPSRVKKVEKGINRMKTIIVLIATLILGGITMASEAEKTVFYVATDGNDEWQGTYDKPFATLRRARDAARGLKQPVNVFVRGGNYFLDEPLTFTPEDSGIAENPVVFAAYKDEKPVISAGRKITGWKPVTIDGKNLWCAEINDVKDGKWFFRQLWVNGQRRFRTRHPQNGYLSVEAVPDAGGDWFKGQTNFQFKEGDIKAWSSIENAEMVVMCRWVDSHLQIKGVDEEKRLVNFHKRTVFRLDPGDPYYIEHIFELLGTPGQWYLDKNSGKIYYMPMPGEDMNEAEVIAPALEQTLRLEGNPESGKYVENLTFKGITFSHTQWWFPESSEIGGFAQAAVGVPGAIYGNGVRNFTLEDCNIGNIGNYAIELARGCQNNRVVNCQLFDIGAGGVKIGETAIRDNVSEQTFGNEISNCHIYDGAKVFHPAIGIWVGQSYNNRMAYNHIHDFYYSGFSIGWTWGYGKALAQGNIVEFNHVHHIGVRSNGDGPILSDMGGIYTLGMQPGTVIRNNIFHDIAGLRYGGWGIYFDEGSTQIVAENNLVYRTTHGGFHQHYGRENIVRNNIFAFGRDQQIQCSRPENHTRFIFEGNIVYWKEGKLIAGNIDFNFAFDRNVYWKEGGGDIRFGEMTLEEWQAKGMDKNSLIADPLFIDLSKDNYRLKSDSPAIKLGFKIFGSSRIIVKKE